MENKNKLTVSSLIAILLLLIMVTGASFAYFGSFKQEVNSTANINVTTQKGFNTTFTSTSAPLELHATLANMIASSPGSVVAESNVNLNVSLALGGTGTTYKCLYDIVFEYDAGSDVYGSDDIPVTNISEKELTLTVLSQTASGTNNFSDEKNFAYDSSWESVNNTFRKTIVKDASITDSSVTGTTNTWNLNLKFYLLSESQAKVQGKTFNGSFFVDNIRCGVK